MKIIAGTKEGVFVVDKGSTRQTLAATDVWDLVETNGYLFASTGKGLFRSNDAGESWQLAGLDNLEVWQTRSASDGVLYACTQPPALYRSTDSGETWLEVESFAHVPEAADWCLPTTPVTPGRARALVIDRNDPSRIWVGIEVGGIMHTSDAGKTWSLVVPGDNPDVHMMYADPKSSDVIYTSAGFGRFDGVAELVEGNAGVYRSEDGGKTWHFAWRGVTPLYARPMCIDLRPPFGLTVATAPGAGSHYSQEGGAKAMLFRSYDGGESWISLCDDDHSPSSANIHGLTPDPEHPGGVLIGTDTGEVWAISPEAEWSLLGSGMPSVLSVAVG